MYIFIESINESLKGFDAKFVVHACFSGNDYKALAPQMPEIKAEQYTLEFANRDTWNTGLDDDARKGFQVLKLFKLMSQLQQHIQQKWIFSESPSTNL